MVRFKSVIVTAILALGLLGVSPSFAGPKNGDGGGDNGGDNGGDHGSKNGGGDHGSKNGGGDHHYSRKGGGGGGYERRIVVCVVNGQVFYVRKTTDCGQRVVVRHKVKKYHKTVRYTKSRVSCCAPCINKNGGGGDYVIGGGGFIGSPAAVAQARRRAGGEEQVVVYRHKRFGHGAVYSGQYSGYNQGVVLHYGPAIVKDGGF